MSAFGGSLNLLLFDIASLHAVLLSCDTTVEDGVAGAFSKRIFDVRIFHLICHSEGKETRRN